MMQCSKCKDFVDDERNAFCPNCGTPLAAPEPVPQPVPQEEQPAPETPETAQPPVQEPPVQQPVQPVYQFIQPGQPFPQPPQGVQQIVYVCQPAPRPKNGGAITGFVFGTLALAGMLMELLMSMLQFVRYGAFEPSLEIFFILAIPGLVLGIVSTCKKSCTKRVFVLLALIFSAAVMVVFLAYSVATAQIA